MNICLVTRGETHVIIVIIFFFPDCCSCCLISPDFTTAVSVIIVIVINPFFLLILPQFATSAIACNVITLFFLHVALSYLEETANKTWESFNIKKIITRAVFPPELPYLCSSNTAHTLIFLSAFES